MTRIGDHFFTALGVVGFACGAHFGGAVVFGNHVGSVQGIVQRTPTGVGGVQGIACVQNGDDQLRASLLCQLGIDFGGGDAGLFWHRNQIANFF